MARPLNRAMLISRKLPRTLGVGEAWCYIVPGGLDICVARDKGEAASGCFTVSVAKMRRALAVIDADQRAKDKKP